MSLDPQLEQHYGSITYTNLSVQQVATGVLAELASPHIYESQTDNPDTVTIAAVDHVTVANFATGERQVVSPREFIGDSRVALGRVAMLTDGRFVASNRDGELFSGVLGSNNLTERIGKTHNHQFGILAGGSIVVLDEERRVRVDGKLSHTATPDIRHKRLFRAAVYTPTIADKLTVVGDRVLVEKTVTDRAHTQDLIDARHSIFISSGGFERSDFYWQPWTNMAHMIMRLDGSRGDLVHVSSFEQSNVTGLAEIPESGSFDKLPSQLDKSSRNVTIHPGGFTAQTIDHQNIEPDLWLPRWDWPLYEQTVFYRDGSRLGSVRVNKHTIARSAIAGALDGSVAYVGKRDGTVELVDFSDKKSEMIGLAHTGDYRHRLPPRYISQWKAHEKSLKRIFALASGNIATVDADGNIAKWEINKDLA